MQLKFNSFTKNIDGQEYCSEVETLAENMIESNEQDATIVYPAPDKWATFRAENFRLTTDSLAIVLPYPIYKIKSLKIKPYGLTIAILGTTKKWEGFKNNNGDNFIVDATKFVVLPDEYNALPVPSVDENTTDRVTNKSKANRLVYEQGSKQIRLSSDSYKITLSSHPVYLGFIAAAIATDENAKNYNDYAQNLWELAPGIIQYTSSPVSWEFQIEYIPMTSATKMKAHKSEPTTQGYTQVVNQRAEVNNAEAFGRYLHLTAQKTGTEKIAIAKIYTKLEDVPPIGAVVKHKGERYRLISNSWSITNPFTFTVTHLLSKNWSSKSKHISVDQKYRNWSIPFDSYIWRTIYYEEFVEVGNLSDRTDSSAFGLQPYKCIEEVFSTNEQTIKPLRNLFLYRGTDSNLGYGVVVPTTAMAVGNSFVISATMQDNLSAGLQISATNSEYCEEVMYCEPDGTLENAYIALSPTINEFDSSTYPAVIPGVNQPSRIDFGATFYLDKDAGEAIKTSIQVHFLPNTDWVVVGNALAQKMPYITDEKRQLRLYALKEHIRDGVDKLDADTLNEARTLVADDNSGFSYDNELEVNSTPTGWADLIACNGLRLSFSSKIDEWMDENKSVYKAWAITDENDNLLIGSNDLSKRDIRFAWKRRRSKK